VFDRVVLNGHVTCYSVRFYGFNPFEEPEFENEEWTKPKSTYFEYSTLSTDIQKTDREADKEVLAVRMG